MLKEGLLSLIILFLYISNLFGQYSDNPQVKNIREEVYEINKTASFTDSFKIELDSIICQALISKRKIIIYSHFEKSKSDLEVNFFFNTKGDPIYINTRERSPKFNDLFRFSHLYYNKGKLIHESYPISIRSCMNSLDMDRFDVYGYNRVLDASFIKKYIEVLLKEIKNK